MKLFFPQCACVKNVQNLTEKDQNFYLLVETILHDDDLYWWYSIPFNSDATKSFFSQTLFTANSKMKNVKKQSNKFHQNKRLQVKLIYV